MPTHVIAILGSYRVGGITEQAVDAILAGSQERGATTHKLRLMEKRIEFCTDCRTCTQDPGPERGWCVQTDDMESILTEVEHSQGIVLAAPVHCYNVTAVFRKFLERMIGFTYWPWGELSPDLRARPHNRRAVLVSSGAMPGFLLPLATGAPRSLRSAARLIGATTVGTLWIGQSAHQHPRLADRLRKKARMLGGRLA